MRPAVTPVRPQVTPEISIWANRSRAVRSRGVWVRSDVRRIGETIGSRHDGSESSAYLIMNEEFASGLVAADFIAG